ncbi:MAG: phosphopentomutase [Candidatus Gastranaerophilales bacterium]|nr:phosphopentomutase [Candidatus Gastranaerophilales bacterium]
MKRVILLIIDSCGIGALPDAEVFGDPLICNTIKNVADKTGGLNVPVMKKMGLGNLCEIKGVAKNDNPIASYGIMKEVSHGKDTTTGHWEIAGLVLEKPFRTYPNGFPKEIIDLFIEKTGCKNILGNYPASGTKIIEDLGEEHQKTGYPIIYTSADSVFQIACHVDTVPLEKLYQWCEIAREILTDEYNVSRVIARPFETVDGKFKRISGARHDYSVAPPKDTMLNLIEKSGGSVYGIGKIEDIFVKSGITRAIHTGSNREGLELTFEAVKQEAKDDLIFVNLVDTDMLYGHRNDAVGYKNALEEIDKYLAKIISVMKKEDLLIITADHGCDPTMPGTDHSREQVPVLVYQENIEAKNLGTRKTFADVCATILQYLDIENNLGGTSF